MYNLVKIVFMKKSARNSKEVIKQLKDLLLKGNAHVHLDDALKSIPLNQTGAIPKGLPYSIWQLAEHIRLAQWDILEFSRNPDHKSPKWPEGYWVKAKKPKTAAEWNKCIAQIKKDRKDFISLLEKEDADLYTPFPWGEGQNLVREALVIADHNSYHVGEILVVRRLLGEWKK